MGLENGSRVLNSDRTTTGMPAIDGDFTLVAKGDNKLYAANVRDNGERFEILAGGHHMEFRVAGSADAWVTVTTTTIVKLVANGTLVNDATLVSGSERAARVTTDPFVASGNEFETEADGTLDIGAEVRDERTEAQFSLDFAAAADDTNYEFRTFWPNKDLGQEAFLHLANIKTPVAAGGLSIPVAMASYRRRRVS